jgi:phosphoribosylglycinamide formyltransferase-1
MPKLIIGFLASHGGSNMQAIVDEIKSGRLYAEAGCVISNNSKSGASERADKEGIPFYHISGNTHPEPHEHDKALIEVMLKHNVNIVVLAGYMRKLGAAVINKWHGRVLNIHPALLPKFGGEGMWGMHVHEAVKAAGEKITGPTVHLVDEEYDRGKILAQAKVFIDEEDTPETIAAKVLEKEHQLYPEVLRKISVGIIRL